MGIDSDSMFTGGEPIWILKRPWPYGPKARELRGRETWGSLRRGATSWASGVWALLGTQSGSSVVRFGGEAEAPNQERPRKGATGVPISVELSQGDPKGPEMTSPEALDDLFWPM